MINLFYAQQELSKATSRLDEARNEGNQGNEEKAMKDINFVCQEVAGTILEELNEDELTRIQAILDEANNRIQTLELFNSLRMI